MIMIELFEGPCQETAIAALKFLAENNFKPLTFGAHFTYRDVHQNNFRVLGFKETNLLIICLDLKYFHTVEIYELIKIVESPEKFLTKFSISFAPLNHEKDLSSNGVGVFAFKYPDMLRDLGVELLHFYDALDSEYLTVLSKQDFCLGVKTLTSDEMPEFLLACAKTNNLDLSEHLAVTLYKYLLIE